MARQFAPKHFLRMASNTYLDAYFKQKGVLTKVSFDGRSETDIDEIYDAWQALPSVQRGELDIDFSEINALATEDAVATLIKEAKYLGIELGEEFSRVGG